MSVDDRLLLAHKEPPSGDSEVIRYPFGATFIPVLMPCRPQDPGAIQGPECLVLENLAVRYHLDSPVRNFS